MTRFLINSGLAVRSEASPRLLREFTLSHATLSGAFLSNTDLSGAFLINADLSGARYLYTADLIGTVLFKAEGITNEKLEQQAASLEGAILPLPPGIFSTNKFELAFLIEAGEDWTEIAPEKPDQVWIQRGLQGGQLLFTSPSDVFDASNPSEQKKLPAPENSDEWVSWLRSHPNLDTSKPVPVSVGGTSGMRIDVTTSSTPQNYPREFCGEQPCVPLYPLSEGSGIMSSEGFKDRLVIVDVGGQTVVIDVAARADKFEEFLPKAQKVLDTVEWRNG